MSAFSEIAGELLYLLIPMGEVLALLFIGTVFFVSGMILAFTTDDKGRKYGIILIVIGLLVYFFTWMFTPNDPRYHLRDENIYRP